MTDFDKIDEAADWFAKQILQPGQPISDVDAAKPATKPFDPFDKYILHGMQKAKPVDTSAEDAKKESDARNSKAFGRIKNLKC